MRHVQQIVIDRDGGIVRVVLAGEGLLHIPDLDAQIADIMDHAIAAGLVLAQNFTIEHTETTK